MFKIAKCIFPTGPKIYEYRIPSYLSPETVLPGHVAVVSKRPDGDVNEGIARVVEVIDALDGAYDGDYTYIIGTVDPAPYEQIRENEKKRKRLLTLMRNERKRLIENMEFDQLIAMSPQMKELSDQLNALG